MLVFSTWKSIQNLKLSKSKFNSAPPLSSSDIAMSFKIIFLELALETPSAETLLRKVIKTHLQRSHFFLLTAATLSLCYSKRFFPVTHYTYPRIINSQFTFTHLTPTPAKKTTFSAFPSFLYKLSTGSLHLSEGNCQRRKAHLKWIYLKSKILT